MLPPRGLIWQTGGWDSTQAQSRFLNFAAATMAVAPPPKKTLLVCLLRIHVLCRPPQKTSIIHTTIHLANLAKILQYSTVLLALMPPSFQS